MAAEAGSDPLPGELRQDPTSGAWVIVSPGRAARPGAARKSAPVAVPAHDATCPFCPGNEAQLPRIIAETPDPAGAGWLMRVVPNKFPAFTPPSPAGFPGETAHRPAIGVQEVILDTPRHDLDLTDLDAAHMQRLVELYRSRYRALLSMPGIVAATVFRNRGRSAGASLLHPHSQAVGLGTVPPRFATIARWAAERHAAAVACATCRMLQEEEAAAVRLVAQDRHVLTLVPLAATAPLEQWLVPRRHHASFADCDDAEVAAIAQALRQALTRLLQLHGPVPYNFAIESWPDPQHAESCHWRLRIVPDLTTPGGLELATGLTVNPASPERDAADLRAVLPCR